MQATPALPPTAGCRLPTAGGALREAELHRLWLEQRFPDGALTTVGGEPVRVLYRGRPGGGAGPDFRDARVSVGGATPRLGDVELHVTAADFRRHGHETDSAYGRVVLHVVFDANGDAETTLPGGGVAPVLALRPWVERRSAEILAWLERSAPWREPCHTAVSRIGAPAVLTVLDRGGMQRLHDKAETLVTELLSGEESEQVLYRTVCGTLGLTRNVQPFRLLAERAPFRVLAGEVVGSANADAEARLRRRLHAEAGFGPEAPVLGALPWRLDGLRPNAHPAKRLGGLAAILARHRHAGLEQAFRDAATAGAPALVRAVTAPGIGRDRAVEIAVNAVLPFLIATGDEEQALALAGMLPTAAGYGPLTTLSTALVDGGRPLVTMSVLAQQGGLALHRDWCRRGGCGVCPLS
ncbi:MAG: DUF2851 family protein [Dehalococcoidia bacterium]